MTTKIHSDLWEVFGPDWANLTPEQINCLAETVHTMELLGSTPNLRGFVGTQRVDNVVGGYFAIQYQEEELHYRKRDELERRPSTPFQRLFFVLFAQTGKLLLQSRKFADIPITPKQAEGLFRETMNQALAHCGIEHIIGFYAPKEYTTDQEFLREFQRSTRVVKIQVTHPNPSRIPEDIEYYNPRRERNKIIRGSHQHDYSHFKKVDLEATSKGNLKDTHIAQDLMLSSTPQILTYYVDQDNYELRRQVQNKFEFYVDMDSDQLPMESLLAVIDRLRRQRAIFIDTPTTQRPEPQQTRMSLFDISDEEGQ